MCVRACVRACVGGCVRACVTSHCKLLFLETVYFLDGYAEFEGILFSLPRDFLKIEYGSQSTGPYSIINSCSLGFLCCFVVSSNPG